MMAGRGVLHFPHRPKGPRQISPGQSGAAQPRSAAPGSENTIIQALKGRNKREVPANGKTPGDVVSAPRDRIRRAIRVGRTRCSALSGLLSPWTRIPGRRRRSWDSRCLCPGFGKYLNPIPERAKQTRVAGQWQNPRRRCSGVTRSNSTSDTLWDERVVSPFQGYCCQTRIPGQSGAAKPRSAAPG
jgi:hypothetical protein